MDAGRWTLDTGHWTLDAGHSGAAVSGIHFRVLQIESRDQALELKLKLSPMNIPRGQVPFLSFYPLPNSFFVVLFRYSARLLFRFSAFCSLPLWPGPQNHHCGDTCPDIDS